MSPEPGSPSPDNMQFEKAEFTTPQPAGLICQACKKTISDIYFEVNGKVFCATCKAALDKALRGGSKAKRVFLSVVAGTGAAILGAVLYYAIVKLTGYEIGWIAIIVGFMVGFAVKWGSEGRGGWAYQLLAMFLTYNALVLTYLPAIFEGFKEGEKKEAAAKAAPLPAAPASQAQGASQVSQSTTVASATTPGPAAAAPATVDPAQQPVTSGPYASTAASTIAPSAAPTKPESEEMTFGKALLGIGAILFIAYIAPFLAGFKNIIGLAIIAFGLYEAWKINARPRIVINGPFQAGPPKL